MGKYIDIRQIKKMEVNMYEVIKDRDNINLQISTPLSLSVLTKLITTYLSFNDYGETQNIEDEVEDNLNEDDFLSRHQFEIIENTLKKYKIVREI